MALTLTYLTQIWHNFSRSQIFPYITLLAWILPLLIFHSQQNSLMAHDEGLYATRARLMFESGNWIHPWSDPHHKTPGEYWIIAIYYSLFGISEFSVRFPNMIFGIDCMFLLYKIGQIILKKKVAKLLGLLELFFM